MIKNLFVTVVATLASTAAAKPPLQLLSGPGTRLEPTRIASIKKVNGQISMTSDWMPYNSFSDRAIPSGCLFDCYGRDWTLAATGVPDGPFDGCAPVGARYYFGAGAHNYLWQDDLLLHRNGSINEFDWAWYNGGATANMTVLVLTGDGDMAACTPLSNGVGVIFSYTQVPTGGYYYSNVNIPGGWSMSTFETSYEVILADSYNPVTNTFVPATGPVQPMLWGTPANLIAASPTGILNVLPGSYGDQGETTFDDDASPDGVFDPLLECYSYDFGPGLCVNWMGKMVAFGGGACCNGVCPPGSGPFFPPQTYGISGTASGTPWSWTLTSSTGGWTLCDAFVPSVAAGGTAYDLAVAFAASINNATDFNGLTCAGAIQATATPAGTNATLSIQTRIPNAFTLHVGPAGSCLPSQCCVCPGPCSFNPQIKRLCPADFDGDEFVTGDDFDGYVAAFEAGNASADFDLDGFVTGDDFDFYVAAFEGGC